MIKEKDASGFSNEEVSKTKQNIPSQIDPVEGEDPTFHVEGNMTDQMINVTMQSPSKDQDGITPIAQKSSLINIAPQQD